MNASTRGRYWLYVRKPSSKRWSKAGNGADAGYFAAYLRTQQEALAQIQATATKWAARGYRTKLDLQLWEELPAGGGVDIRRHMHS